VIVSVKVQLTPEQAEAGRKALADQGILVEFSPDFILEFFQTMLDQAEIIVAYRAES